MRSATSCNSPAPQQRRAVQRLLVGRTMSSLYRNGLPQLDGGFFLTDGGIETSLIFNDGLELPDFAAFHLFSRPGGEAALRRYFNRSEERRVGKEWRSGWAREA